MRRVFALAHSRERYPVVTIVSTRFVSLEPYSLIGLPQRHTVTHMVGYWVASTSYLNVGYRAPDYVTGTWRGAPLYDGKNL